VTRSTARPDRGGGGISAESACGCLASMALCYSCDGGALGDEFFGRETTRGSREWGSHAWLPGKGAGGLLGMDWCAVCWCWRGGLGLWLELGFVGLLCRWFR
jgi:hypothetical protein